MFELFIWSLVLPIALVQGLPVSLETSTLSNKLSSFSSGEIFADKKTDYTPRSFAINNCAFEEDLLKAARYSSIAYCVDRNGLDSGYIEDSSALGACSMIDKKTTKVNYVFKGDVSGLIMTNYDTKEIIVSFKGTTTEQEWAIDFTYTQFDYTPYVVAKGKNTRKFNCDGCLVHGGFYKSISIFASKGIPVVLQLAKQNPDFTLLVTGHSLGGALAVLGAVELNLLGLNPRTITLGGPKVADPNTAEWIDNSFKTDNWLGNLKSSNVNKTPPGRYTRLTHEGDIVPLVPLHSMNFKHAGVEIEISSGHKLNVYGKYSTEREDYLLDKAIGSATKRDSNAPLDKKLKTLFDETPIIAAHQQYFFTVPVCHDQCLAT